MIQEEFYTEIFIPVSRTTYDFPMFDEPDSDDASYEVNGDTLTITDGDESVDFTRE